MRKTSNPMSPQQALQILDQATQPGVRLSRQNYCDIQMALATLNAIISTPPTNEPPKP